MASTTAVYAGARAPLGAAFGPPSTIAVYGDAPYGTSPTDTTQLTMTPAFIGTINADPDVSVVLHVGDIHSGKQYCTEPYDSQIFDLWQRFEDPLVYTPGDNEWRTATRPQKAALVRRHAGRDPLCARCDREPRRLRAR